MIFVDTNVLIDIVEDDLIWADWSRQQLITAAGSDEVAINDVVYAELSIGYARLRDADAAVSSLGVIVVPIPRIALFIAGKAYQRYRAAGGRRTGVLPDFFIGAQALFEGAQLITRDARRYRTYFPELSLITPNVN